MTRKEQRSLLESLFDLRALLPRTELREAGERTLLEETLSAAESLCARTLSSGRTAFYQELFGGMLTALQSADWASLSAVQETEIRTLLDELLEAAIRTVQGEKEVKKLFLFLPYKASMWDSLESIWKAAAEDVEHTEAHVVPIPYADRNPDGSAAAWHCEADDFPDYVPVEDWQDYTLDTLKELRPDAIFIHNPYDANNYVTSVEGQYYSDKLKECTDCLVYVPYFVSGESVSKSTVVTSGVMNADYVIVESENIREQYIAYTRPLGVDEKKFLALGSPKFDAVLSAKKEDFSLPLAWEKILKGKKVVLFGTSLAPILQNTEHVFQKTREILAFFRGHREIALWWRPHPLVRSTLKSMRGDVYEEYCQIEDEYKQEGWGIFDDSGDLDRAIAWADIYYGDPSSVCTLFTAAKKPVILMVYDYTPQMMNTWQIDMEENSLFFLEYGSGVFFEIDTKTRNRTGVIPIPRRYWKHHAAFGAFVRNGNTVVLFPHNAHHIYTMDLLTQEMQEIGTVQNTYAANGAGTAIHAIAYGEHVYCIGARSNEMLRYDFQSGQITHLKDWYMPLQEIFGLGHEADEQNNLFLAWTVNDETLMIVLKGGNLLLEFNMETEEWTLHQLDMAPQTWNDIAFDGTYYYLVGRENASLIRWHEETGEMYKYQAHLSLLNGAEGNVPPCYIENKKNEIHLLFSGKPFSIAVEKATGKARMLDVGNGTVYHKERAGGESYIYHVVEGDGDALVLDTPKGRMEYPITWDFLHKDVLFQYNGTDKGIFLNTVPLSFLPDMLKEYGAQQANRDCEKAGERIYSFVRRAAVN